MLLKYIIELVLIIYLINIICLNSKSHDIVEELVKKNCIDK